MKNSIYEDKDKETENKISQNQVESFSNNEKSNLEIIHNDINKVDNNISNGGINNGLKDNIPILLETKKNKKSNKKRKKDTHLINDKIIDFTEEKTEDDSIFSFCDGDEGRSLNEGEHLVVEWSF